MTFTCSICGTPTEVEDKLLVHLHYIHLFQVDPQCGSEIAFGIEEWARDLRFVTLVSPTPYLLDKIFFTFDDALLCVNCGMAQWKELKEMLDEIRNFPASFSPSL
jgi:hypothetical protein